MIFDLFSLAETIQVTADEDGIRIRSTTPEIDIGLKETWPEPLSAMPGGWKIAVQIEQLLELGFASKDLTACRPARTF